MTTSTTQTATMDRLQSTTPLSSYNTTFTRIRKSCLKSPSPRISRSNSSDNTSTPMSFPTMATLTGDGGYTLDSELLKKCVSFDENECTVFTADDWDRTPTEPARKLSYQDILELKEIQKSLPRAAQPWDPSNRRSKHILSSVPIELLPLLPSSSPGHGSSTPPQNSTPNSSPVSSASNSGTSSPVPQPAAESITYTAPSSLFPRGIRIQRTGTEGSPPPPPPPQQQQRAPHAPFAHTISSPGSSNNTKDNAAVPNVTNPHTKMSPAPSSISSPSPSSPSGSKFGSHHGSVTHLHLQTQPLSLAPPVSSTPSFSNPASPQSRLGPFAAPKPVLARRKPTFNFVALLDGPQSPQSDEPPASVHSLTGVEPVAPASSECLTPPAVSVERTSPSSSLSTPTPTEPVVLPIIAEVPISAMNDSDIEESTPSPTSSTDSHHYAHSHHGDSNPLVDPPTPSLTNASLDSSPSPSPNFDLELELDELDLNLGPKIHGWDYHPHQHHNYSGHHGHYGAYGRGHHGYHGHGHGGSIPEEGLSALGMDIVHHAGPVDVGKELLDADAWREEMRAEKARLEVLTNANLNLNDKDQGKPVQQKKKKQVIVINDVEIELDDDEEDEELVESVTMAPPSPSHSLTPTPTPSPPPISRVVAVHST